MTSTEESFAALLGREPHSERSAPDWLAPINDAVARAPEPAQARQLAASVLDAAPRAELRGCLERDARNVARVLSGLCGIAPFFARSLLRHPEWLIELANDDLSQPRSFDDRARRLDEHLEGGPAVDLAERLREFKYLELARITVRDACKEWVPLASSGVTLSEISELADVLLDRALAVARTRVGDQLSPPVWRDEAGVARELGFCVLGLGKLGASELNYSSDVDLIYIHESPPPQKKGTLEGSEPGVYFSKLAQVFGELVSASSIEGFLYRVDLELRPEGTQGKLVVSADALSSYYENWAAMWEKAAFMKARPVAGDVDLGWRTIRAIAPAIYHSSMNFRAVEGIRGLKEKIASVRGGKSRAFNVKIDPGGIRDVEFIAQVLQLLHGGRIPQVRGRSTQEALRNLAAVKLLERETAERLMDTYLFLRRLENRLQMEAERQVHRLPTRADALQRLARAMGYEGEDASAQLDARIHSCRGFLEQLLASEFGEGNSERVLEIFERSGTRLMGSPQGRELIEDLASRFAKQIDESPDAERALNNLDRFIQGIGQRQFYFELLLDRPELVARLSALFAASNFLSGFIARYPTLIEPLFENPSKLLLGPEELAQDFEAVLAGMQDESPPSLEAQLDAVRLFHHRQIVNVGLLDLAGECERANIDQALTEIAETCIEVALAVSNEQLASRAAGVPASARDGAFLIVGMGKLASRELTYGSDLDLIFIYESGSDEAGAVAEAQEHFIRVAQRFISALQTATTQGSCYEVDARLRPSGNQGMLVTSMQGFERYHAERAEIWERQALLRSRPVAGDPGLAQRYDSLRRSILSAPLPDDLAAEIHRVRLRMETELARETSERRDFKTGRGGALDVESVVQYLQLCHASEHPELLDVTRLEVQLDRLERLGRITEQAARELRQGWRFLQTLGSRLRIVENRSISDIDVEHTDLDSIARQIGYPGTGREGGARRALLRDYDHHTERIRAIYLELLCVSEQAPS